MGLPATFVLYLVIGVGVEGALLTSRDSKPVARWFSVLTGILFWPFYVPILLTPHDDQLAEESTTPTENCGDRESDIDSKPLC